MKFLSRTLAMILSLQLAVGCQGEQFKFNTAGGGIVGDDEIEISGSIARSFNVISEIIFPSAMAQESGTLHVWDATDPTDPQLLHKEEIVNQNSYSVKFKKSAVEGLLLKVEFVGAAKSRVFLTAPSVAEKIVSAPLNATKTAEHRIILKVLQKQIDDGDIEISSVRDAYEDLKSEDISGAINEIGESSYMESILSDSKYSTDASTIMVEYFLSKKLSDDYLANKQTAEFLKELLIQNQLIQKLAYNLNTSLSKPSVSLNCAGLNAYLIVSKEDKKYMFTFAPAKDTGLLGSKSVATNSFEEANKILAGYTESLMKVLEKVPTASATILLMDESGAVEVSRCTMSYSSEGETQQVAEAKYVDLSPYQKFDYTIYKSYEEVSSILNMERAKSEENLKAGLMKMGMKDPELSSTITNEMSFVDSEIKALLSNAYIHFGGGQQRRM